MFYDSPDFEDPQNEGIGATLITAALVLGGLTVYSLRRKKTPRPTPIGTQGHPLDYLGRLGQRQVIRPKHGTPKKPASSGQCLLTPTDFQNWAASRGLVPYQGVPINPGGHAIAIGQQIYEYKLSVSPEKKAEYCAWLVQNQPTTHFSE